LSAFGVTADKGGFWPGMVCPLMTDTVEKGVALVGPL
jgi:hypothetical protein